MKVTMEYFSKMRKEISIWVFGLMIQILKRMIFVGMISWLEKSGSRLRIKKDWFHSTKNSKVDLAMLSLLGKVKWICRTFSHIFLMLVSKVSKSVTMIQKLSATHWLISDLIPKKYEKFEFSKTFATIIFVQIIFHQHRCSDFWLLKLFIEYSLKSSGWHKWSESHRCSDSNEVSSDKRIWKTAEVYWWKF